MPKGEWTQQTQKDPTKKDETKMGALRKRIANLKAKHKGTIEKYLINYYSPFIENMLAEPLPKKLIMPQFTGYKGKGDPLDHLDKYTFMDEATRSQYHYHMQGFSLNNRG